MNLNLVICPRPGGLGVALVLRVQIREAGLENPHHFIRKIGDLDEVQVNTVLILFKGWVMADREGKGRLGRGDCPNTHCKGFNLRRSCSECV